MSAVKKADERHEELHEVTLFRRLDNSPAGNARWELDLAVGYRVRTAHDSQAGAAVTGIVDGLALSADYRLRSFPAEPVAVVLTLDGYSGVRGVRLAEEGQR